MSACSTPPNTYNVGSIATLTSRFYSQQPDPTDPDLYLADPSSVELIIEDPYDAIVDATTPTRLSLGIWTFPYAPLVPGMHQIRWIGTGTIQVAGQEQIFVRAVNT